MQKRFLIFLASLSLVAMLLGGVATLRYGAGVASDSVKYLAVAQSLLDGRGLADHRGSPLMSWPPLYSMVLAGLGFITRVDVFVVGWYLNIFLLGANLFLSGLLFWRAFQNRPVFAYLAVVFVWLSVSSLRLHATIFSEPLYLTMTLGFLLIAQEYIQTRSRRAFWGMLVLSALAPMLRYVGLAFPVTAILIIIKENRTNIGVLFRDGVLLGVLSILPIGWWLILRNVMTYGSLFGRGEVPTDPYQNTILALAKMLHWFVPYFAPILPIFAKPLYVLAGLAVVLGVINFRQGDRFRAWFQTLAGPVSYPALIYAVVYFLAVVLTILISDHSRLDEDDRYYVILLVPVMIFALHTFAHLLQPRMAILQRAGVIMFLFVIWSLYPLNGLREYLVKAREMGEPSVYNLFNTRAYHESAVVAEMQKLRSDHPAVIAYSNYVDAVWFYTRKPVKLLPFRDVPEANPNDANWLRDEPGYLIWFKPNEYLHYLEPRELAASANLNLLFTSEAGDIYYISAK